MLDIVRGLGENRQVLRDQVMCWLEFMQKVIEQTRQRVLLGRKLVAGEKIVSVFETHTDILAKERRDTVFGLDRCNWRGQEGFHAYVWTSIIAYNLVVLARHCIERKLII